MPSKLGLSDYFKINHLWIKTSLIFLFFFSLFLAAHSLNSGFTSVDDPYYHAKHAFLIEQTGQLNLVEPWLEFHFFNYAPVDPWWGFHLGMALFIHLLGLFLGVKIFISFLAALIFLVLYLILSNLKIKYPASWVFLLFFSSTIFDYRLFSERPHLLSMAIFPLAGYFLIKNKNFWLFVLVLIYTLSYHLAWLIVLPVVLYILADCYYKKQINLKPLIASAGGILAGVIIHPNSLNYLYFMFITLPNLFLLKFSGVNWQINELQLLDFSESLKSNFLVLAFFILASSVFFFFKKKNTDPTIGNFLFLYSCLWLIVTLVIPRGVEYWLPITFIFIAVMFNDFIRTEEFKRIKNWLAKKINFKIVSFFLISILALVVFNNLSQVFFDLYYDNTAEGGANYEQANIWLKANTKEDSVVFYDNWGMWPMMFFYNDYNHYITGMGPTFLYEYDVQTYWLWRNLTSDGLACDQSTPCLKLSPKQQINYVPLAIKNVFHSEYVAATNNPPGNLVKTLNSLRGQVRLVFKNKDLLIYELL